MPNGHRLRFDATDGKVVWLTQVDGATVDGLVIYAAGGSERVAKKTAKMVQFALDVRGKAPLRVDISGMPWVWSRCANAPRIRAYFLHR